MDDERGAGEAVEKLLRLAGPRETPDEARRARARAAVRGAWRDSVRARARERRILIGLPALAAAAALVLAVVLPRLAREEPPSPVLAARVVAATAPVALAAGGERAAAGMTSAGARVNVSDGIETGPGVVATLALEGGGEVRVNADTALRFEGPRQLTLERGHVYVDSGTTPGSAPLAVRTFAGVVRDIGTRFDVEARGTRLRVRVREGAVRLERGEERVEAAAGQELRAEAGAPVSVTASDTYGADWDWILRGTAYRLEGSTLARFLSWVEREGGRDVVLRGPALSEAAAATVLHGSIEGLTLEEALAVVLPASGLSYRLDGNRIVIEGPAGAGR